VWAELDAEPSERPGDVLLLALIERPIGALHRVAPRAHETGERAHTGTRYAREVIPENGQTLTCLCGSKCIAAWASRVSVTSRRLRNGRLKTGREAVRIIAKFSAAPSR